MYHVMGGVDVKNMWVVGCCSAISQPTATDVGLHFNMQKIRSKIHMQKDKHPCSTTSSSSAWGAANVGEKRKFTIGTKKEDPTISIIRCFCSSDIPKVKVFLHGSGETC